MALNSTPRVLTTAEVLQLVFECCDRRENGRNALVSKNWSNEALPFLWSTSTTPQPISTLGCSDRCKGEAKISQKFRRPIQPARWGVFLKHSRHVYEIQRMRGKYGFCDSVFVYIASSCPVIGLLPNLRHLSYIDGPEAFLPVFVHSKLTHLQLSVDFLEWDQRGTRWLISYLPDRAPNLECLRIEATRRADIPPELGLDIVIGSLPHLRKFFTSSLLTPSLLHTLSLLPSLESRYVKFPLSVDIRPTKVDVPSFATVQDCSRSRSSLPQATKRPISPTNFFRPLCRCSSLTALTLRSPVPICLDITTLIYIVTSLPFLHKLRLEEQLTIPPTLPLSSLVELAPLCPRLKRLALYFDTSLRPPYTEKYYVQSFKALKVLDVGTSPFRSSTKAMTTFLSSVLPQGCSLHHTFHHTFDYTENDALAPAKSEDWVRAAELVSRTSIVLEGSPGLRLCVPA